MSKKTIAEQTKITQTNTFSGGLSLDTPISSTNSNVLTDCINGALITYNGDELLLQNSRGNIRVENSALPMGHIPVSMESHAGILYIISYNPDTNETEIGTYPSPKYINNFHMSENFVNYNIDDVSVYFPEELVSDIKYFWTKKGITVSSTDEYIYDPPTTILPFITHNQYAIDSEGRRELIHLISRDPALSDKDNTYAFPNTYKAYIASQQTPYYVNKLDCRIDTTNTNIPELTILLDNYISDSELVKALDSDKFKLINYVNYYFETESKKKYHVKYLWNCLENNVTDDNYDMDPGNYTYGIDTITPPNDRKIEDYFHNWNKWTPSYKYIKGKDYIYTTGKITFSKYIDSTDDFNLENFAPRLDFFKDGMTADEKVISFDKKTKTLIIGGEECINFVIEYVPCFEASIDDNTCILLFKDLYNKSILPARSVIADKELFSEFKYTFDSFKKTYSISARLNSDVAYGDLKRNFNSNSEVVSIWTFQRLLPNGELEYAGAQAKKTGYRLYVSNENFTNVPVLVASNAQSKEDRPHFAWEGTRLKKVDVPISIFDSKKGECTLPEAFIPKSSNTLNESGVCIEGDSIIVKNPDDSTKYNIVSLVNGAKVPISNGNVVIFDQNETPEIEFTTNIPEDWLKKDNIYIATLKWQIADSSRPVKSSELPKDKDPNEPIVSIQRKDKFDIEEVQKSIQEYSNMNPIVVDGVGEMTASFIMCMTESMVEITDEKIRRYDKLMLEEWWISDNFNVSYYVENGENIFEPNNSAYLTNRVPLEFQTEDLSYDVNKFVAHYNHILKNDSIKNNNSNIILGFNSSNRRRSLSWGSILQNELPGYSSKISHTIKSKVTSQSGSNPIDLNSVYHPNNVSCKIIDGTLSYTWSDEYDNDNSDKIDINKNLYLIDNNKSVDDLITITSENRIYLDYDRDQSLGDILNKDSSKMIFHNCERRYMIEYLNVLNWPYNQKYIPWLLDDVEKEISFKSKRIYGIDDGDRIGIHNNLASSEKVFIGYDKSDTSEDREYHLLLRSGSDQSVMKCEPYKNGKCKAGFNWTTFWHALFIISIVGEIILGTVILAIVTGAAGAALIGAGLTIITAGGLGVTYWKNAFKGLQTDISKTGYRALIYGTSKTGCADSISLQLMDVNSGNNMMPSFKKGKLCCENYVGYGDKNETKKWIKRIWSRAWVVHKKPSGEVEDPHFNIKINDGVFHGYSLIGYSIDDYNWERFENVMGAFAKHAYALTPCNVGKTTENDQVYEFYFKNTLTEYTKNIKSIDGLNGNVSLYPKQCNVIGNLENLNIQSWNNLISSQSVWSKNIDNEVDLSSNLNTIDEKYRTFLLKLCSTINDYFINKDQIFKKDFMNIDDTNQALLMSLNIYMDYNDPLFLNEEMTESKTFDYEPSFEEFKLDYVRDIIYKEVDYNNFTTDYFKYTQPCNTNKVHWNIKSEWPFKDLHNDVDALNNYVSIHLLNKYGK